ncbi:MAG: helix-hairpin-helix domain-containing protein [Bacilli bacterium]|nr:helix-hairpin-helix domain-containing protein [Bacilli bacterium]
MIKIIIGVCIATIIGICAFTFIPQIVSSTNNPPSNLVDDSNRITIGINGQVVKPGNYILEEGSSMQDLIDKAGGTNSNADTRCYFAETIVEKNMEYYIPPKYDVTDVCSETAISKVNINEADKTELMKVSGFGDTVSSALIQYRNDNGIFYTIEAIMDVNGIGNATFNKVKNYIYLHD